MLLYLFSAEELRGLLADMGYELPADAVVRTVERYSATSTYGSTLSNVVHSWLEARLDRARSWEFLGQALRSDLDDIQHGTTREGVHIAAMAGSVDIVTRCYLGLEMRDDRLWFHPLLPRELELVKFHLAYRDQALSVTVSQTDLTIVSTEGEAAPIRIVVEGTEFELVTGEEQEVLRCRRRLDSSSPATRCRSSWAAARTRCSVAPLANATIGCTEEFCVKASRRRGAEDAECPRLPHGHLGGGVDERTGLGGRGGAAGDRASRWRWRHCQTQAEAGADFTRLDILEAVRAARRRDGVGDARSKGPGPRGSRRLPGARRLADSHRPLGAGQRVLAAAAGMDASTGAPPRTEPLAVLVTEPRVADGDGAGLPVDPSLGAGGERARRGLAAPPSGRSLGGAPAGRDRGRRDGGRGCRRLSGRLRHPPEPPRPPRIG